MTLNKVLHLIGPQWPLLYNRRNSPCRAKPSESCVRAQHRAYMKVLNKWELLLAMKYMVLLLRVKISNDVAASETQRWPSVSFHTALLTHFKIRADVHSLVSTDMSGCICWVQEGIYTLQDRPNCAFSVAQSPPFRKGYRGLLSAQVWAKSVLDRMGWTWLGDTHSPCLNSNPN